MGTRPPDLSTQQKLAVGFAGEWLAYQWLAQQYGPDFTQDCWVSKYREQLFPGGGDGLGWDFEVPVRHAKHYYEVKTTLSDGGQIELGETQVTAAQENARNRQWRLLVITNVLNENRRIHMLRNPFDPDSRGATASSARACGCGMPSTNRLSVAGSAAPAVLQLAEAGNVELAAPLGDYPTGYCNQDVAAKITIIHHLHTHTGGTGALG